MAEKKKSKKSPAKEGEKERIIEEVDIALSENTGISDSEENKIEVDSEDSEEEKESSSSPSTDSIFSTLPEEDRKPKKGKNSLSIIVIVCLFVIALLIGFVGGYFYGKGPGLTVEPTPTPEVVEPTPTPKVEEIDLSAYSIEVLNGSGVAGVAGKEKTELESGGFKVESTGNAETQDFSETSISFKPSVPKAFIEKLKEALATRYEIAPDGKELDSDNEYDVVIILGSEKVK